MTRARARGASSRPGNPLVRSLALLAVVACLDRRSGADEKYRTEQVTYCFAVDGAMQLLTATMPKFAFLRPKFAFSDNGQPGIRQGRGASWNLTGGPAGRESSAHLYIEILAKGETKLATFFDAYLKDLPEITGRNAKDASFVPEHGTPIKLPLGGRSVPALRADYRTKRRSGIGAIELGKSSVVAFDVGSDRVLATTEGFHEAADHSANLLGGLALAKKRPKGDANFQVVDNNRGWYRYVSCIVPDTLVAEYGDAIVDCVAGWQMLDKDGKVIATLRIEAKHVDETPLAEAASVEIAGRETKFLEPSAPEKLRLDGRLEAVAFAYKTPPDASGVAAQARRVYVKNTGELWSWTWESWTTDAKEKAAGEKAFDAILSSVLVWSSAPPP